MSSGKIYNDGKALTFEVNDRRMFGNFTMLHVDGDERNEPRIVLKMKAEAFNSPTTVQSSTMIMVPKAKTMILSHFFRQVADRMDEWYAEQLKGTDLDRSE